MRVRRILWLAAVLMLAWGLYLYLPPRPAWVLAPPQFPLYFSKTHVVTAALLKTTTEEIPWIEFGRFSRNVVVGPICLREMATGRIVGTAIASGESCLTLDMSADLRFLLAASADRQSVAVHDLVTGQRWRPDNGAQVRLSPRGTLIWAAARDSGLFEAESKQLVVRVDPPYELLEMADDDSWALFSKTRGRNTETLLWRHGRKDLLAATLPGVIMQWRMASDNRTLVAHCVDPPRVIVWDVLRGAVCREVKLSFARADLGIALDADGSHLAVWPLGMNGLDLIHVETGKVTAAPTAQVGSSYGFSRGGRQFAYVQPADRRELMVRDSSTAQALWRDTNSPYGWVSGGENLLVMGGKASLRHGATGAEIGVRDNGVLSHDREQLISHEVVSLAEALKLPESLGRWFPFLTIKDKMRVRVTEVDTGDVQFQFLRKTEEKAKGHSVRWPYVARDRLLILGNDGASEFWDLPPAKRWSWILGLPAALAALPWLWRWVQRVKPATASLRPQT